MSSGIDVSRVPQPVEGWALANPALKCLRFLEASARTKRWHTEPTLHTQSVGEHTYSVMQLILVLDPAASRNLLIAALRHDTAERKFGDVPGPTKRMAGVKDRFDAMEDAFMAGLGLDLPELTPGEARLLKLCDMLEGAMFCAFELRRGNRELQEAFHTYLSWIEQVAQSNSSAAIYNQLLEEYTNVYGK